MADRSVHFSTRLPAATAAQLKDFASRHGTTASAAAVRLLEEALRMERHPGIDFRSRPTGRAAFATGTGLSVSEIYRIWLDHGKAAGRVRRNYPHLKRAQMAAAVSYAESYPREVALQLERSSPKKVAAMAPFLKTVRV